MWPTKHCRRASTTRQPRTTPSRTLPACCAPWSPTIWAPGCSATTAGASASSCAAPGLVAARAGTGGNASVRLCRPRRARAAVHAASRARLVDGPAGPPPRHPRSAQPAERDRVGTGLRRGRADAVDGAARAGGRGPKRRMATGPPPGRCARRGPGVELDSRSVECYSLVHRRKVRREWHCAGRDLRESCGVDGAADPVSLEIPARGLSHRPLVSAHQGS